MHKRMIAVTAIAVMVLMCLAPTVSAEKVNEDTGRVIGVYIYEAEFIIPSDLEEWQVENLRDDSFYMVKGSDNQRLMDRFLEDPYSVDMAGDDRDILLENKGKTVYVYRLNSYIYSECSIYFPGCDSKEGEIVMEPRGIEFVVKAGGEMRLTITDIEYYNDIEQDLRFYPATMQYIDTVLGIGDTATVEPGTTTVYLLGMNSYNYSNGETLYIDVTYEVTGNSEPDGSPILFAAICFIIAALMIVLVVIAAIRPKWAE